MAKGKILEQDVKQKRNRQTDRQTDKKHGITTGGLGSDKGPLNCQRTEIVEPSSTFRVSIWVKLLQKDLKIRSNELNNHSRMSYLACTLFSHYKRRFYSWLDMIAVKFRGKMGIKLLFIITRQVLYMFALRPPPPPNEGYMIRLVKLIIKSDVSPFRLVWM